MKDSIVIVAFFIVGVMCGFGNFIPHFVSGNSDISFYALCALMFFVGMSVGCDSKYFRVSVLSIRALCFCRFLLYWVHGQA